MKKSISILRIQLPTSLNVLIYSRDNFFDKNLMRFCWVNSKKKKPEIGRLILYYFVLKTNQNNFNEALVISSLNLCAYY